MQEGVEFASDTTFRQNLAKVLAAYAFASSEMRKAGVKIHQLTPDQIGAFAERCGHQRKEWDDWKKKPPGRSPTRSHARGSQYPGQLLRSQRLRPEAPEVACMANFRAERSRCDA
ncbi:MAG: hypothetical protein R3E48_03660 [Burkholderiaceae bacterium]